MICPNCGYDKMQKYGSEAYCPTCGMNYVEMQMTSNNVIVSIHGLEKIEPIPIYPSTSFDVTRKLNEVIEKVNLLIDLQNKGGEMTTKEEPAQSDRTRKGLKMCADWLLLCLSYGWGEEQLDELEKLWWEHHDGKGNLK